jgi:predicted deacetylase
MKDGRNVLEDSIGRPAAGFIAPAWLYSRGAHDALADAGFAIAEDHFRIWHPPSGRVLSRGPVITWATRTRWRRDASLVAAGLLVKTASAVRVQRLAVHPSDCGDPSVLESIERALARLVERRRPARYAELSSPFHH